MRAGNGADGASGGNGGNAGNGGRVVLRSANGSITIGGDSGADVDAAQAGPAPLLASGDGGDGGEGKLGGAGGQGGDLHFSCPNGTLTLAQVDGLLHVGNGGNGGRGYIGGDDTTVPPEQLPNAGGDSGEVVLDIRDMAAASEDGGLFTGGAGGNAGEFYYGLAPGADDSTWTVGFASARRKDDPWLFNRTVRGAAGGSGFKQGGEGATVSLVGRDPGAGSFYGENVKAIGGKGGDAEGWRYEVWERHPHCRLGEVRPGNGGSAYARGGAGGHGASCQAGGPGGDAHAVGGRAGTIAGAGFSTVRKSVSGGAMAIGGDGGNGGSCCNPHGRGGAGGRGGRAKAEGGPGTGLPIDPDPDTWVGGGVATARGGAGGSGGDGIPAGSGGPGGSAEAKAGEGVPPGYVMAEVQGTAGAAGRTCPSQPPQVPDRAVQGTLYRLVGTPPMTAPMTDWCAWLGYYGERGELVLPGAARVLRPKVQVIPVPHETVDANGRFTFTNVPLGTWEVWPEPVDGIIGGRGLYWQPFLRIINMTGPGIGGQDFLLCNDGGQYQVEVVVRLPGGSPFANCHVIIYDHDGLHDAWTNAQGVATFPAIWSGRWRAVAMSGAPDGYNWANRNSWVEVTTSNVEVSPFTLVAE